MPLKSLVLHPPQLPPPQLHLLHPWHLLLHNILHKVSLLHLGHIPQLARILLIRQEAHILLDGVLLLLGVHLQHLGVHSMLLTAGVHLLRGVHILQIILLKLGELLHLGVPLQVVPLLGEHPLHGVLLQPLVQPLLGAVILHPRRPRLLHLPNLQDHGISITDRCREE